MSRERRKLTDDDPASSNDNERSSSDTQGRSEIIDEDASAVPFWKRKDILVSVSVIVVSAAIAVSLKGQFKGSLNPVVNANIDVNDVEPMREEGSAKDHSPPQPQFSVSLMERLAEVEDLQQGQSVNADSSDRILKALSIAAETNQSHQAQIASLQGEISGLRMEKELAEKGRDEAQKMFTAAVNDLKSLNRLHELFSPDADNKIPAIQNLLPHIPQPNLESLVDVQNELAAVTDSLAEMKRGLRLNVPNEDLAVVAFDSPNLPYNAYVEALLSVFTEHNLGSRFPSSRRALYQASGSVLKKKIEFNGSGTRLSIRGESMAQDERLNERVNELSFDDVFKDSPKETTKRVVLIISEDAQSPVRAETVPWKDIQVDIIVAVRSRRSKESREFLKDRAELVRKGSKDMGSMSPDQLAWVGAALKRDMVISDWYDVMEAQRGSVSFWPVQMDEDGNYKEVSLQHLDRILMQLLLPATPIKQVTPQ